MGRLNRLNRYVQLIVIKVKPGVKKSLLGINVKYAFLVNLLYYA